MKWYFILLIAVGAVAAFVAVTTFLAALLIDRLVFGSRQDKQPEYKYFTPQDFSLTAESVPVRYRGAILAAKLYTVNPAEECDKVVIFQHGFGSGSSSYMTEIAHFAGQGNAVLAADAYGCNDSVGKGVKGFYAGAEAVIAAYIAVRADKRLQDKKVVLVGHSWGAYSVLAASDKVAADGVVSLSGFNAPAQCLCDQMKSLSTGGLGNFYAPLLHGWFYVINFFKFGKKGNTKAVKALQKSAANGTKALLVHGAKDGAVPLKHSAARLAQGENITSTVLPDKHHNPYNTAAAEEKLSHLSDGLRLDPADTVRFYEEYDWIAATEEDAKVMGEIDSFIANV